MTLYCFYGNIFLESKTKMTQSEVQHGPEAPYTQHAITVFEQLPAHGTEYPDQPPEGVELVKLRYPESVPYSARYVQELFPDKSFTLLSDEGSSATVFEDEDGLAYKVYKNSEYYSYVEKEAALLQLLGDAGVAPKLHALVDAGQEYRVENTTLPQIDDFETVQIPRVDSGRPLPVLVMDRIHGIEAMDVPSARIQTACFEKVLLTALNYGLEFGDTEILYEPATQSPKIVDVGGIGSYKESRRFVTQPEGTLVDDYPDLSDTELRVAFITRGVMHFFGAGANVRTLTDIYKSGGINGIVERFKTQVEQRFPATE